MESIKIYGISVGDSSVGIFPIDFEIDTGLNELSKEDKEFLIKNIVRDIWELHDNGDLKFNFSDEEKEVDWNDYLHIMTDEKSKEILKEKKKYFDMRNDLR